MLLLTTLALAADPSSLYLGAAAPVSYTLGGVPSVSLLPLRVETRAKTVGIRYLVDVNMGMTGGAAYSGTVFRMEPSFYLGHAEETQNRYGFFIGPTMGIGIGADKTLNSITGLQLGYAGKLNENLIWRTGAWSGLRLSKEGGGLEVGLTLFEVGGFVM